MKQRREVAKVNIIPTKNKHYTLKTTCVKCFKEITSNTKVIISQAPYCLKCAWETCRRRQEKNKIESQQLEEELNKFEPYKKEILAESLNE